jgi:hypothetical protein
MHIPCFHLIILQMCIFFHLLVFISFFLSFLHVEDQMHRYYLQLANALRASGPLTIPGNDSIICISSEQELRAKMPEIYARWSFVGQNQVSSGQAPPPLEVPMSAVPPPPQPQAPPLPVPHHYQSQHWQAMPAAGFEFGNSSQQALLQPLMPAPTQPPRATASMAEMMVMSQNSADLPTAPAVLPPSLFSVNPVPTLPEAYAAAQLQTTLLGAMPTNPEALPLHAPAQQWSQGQLAYQRALQILSLPGTAGSAPIPATTNQAFVPVSSVVPIANNVASGTMTFQQFEETHAFINLTTNSVFNMVAPVRSPVDFAAKQTLLDLVPSVLLPSDALHMLPSTVQDVSDTCACERSVLEKLKIEEGNLESSDVAKMLVDLD